MHVHSYDQWHWVPLEPTAPPSLAAGPSPARERVCVPQAVYFVRYAHEMNGVWFPWGQEPSAYRASFAAVAGWFRAASCGAMMLWAPNWRACVLLT